MSVYFSALPNVTHTGLLVRDITRRAKIANSIINDKFAYLPYLVTGDEKPEDVAYYYYGNVRYTWLVYYSNIMIDPYFDWPLDTRQFDNYIIQKYEDQAELFTPVYSFSDGFSTGFGGPDLVEPQTGTDVISWAQNTTITNNIKYYKNSDGDRISPDSYTLNPNIVTSEWTPVRYYEYELEKNNDKRSIQLLERSYARTAESQLRELMHGRAI